MPESIQRDYLICYDITHPERLNRIRRLLTQKAIAVQFSVFLFTGTATEMADLLQALEPLLDKKRDDMRAYPLPSRGLRLLFGSELLPEGIFWSGLPRSWNNSYHSNVTIPKLSNFAVDDK